MVLVLLLTIKSLVNCTYRGWLQHRKLITNSFARIVQILINLIIIRLPRNGGLMTTRTFIFCDVCNTNGIRDIESRRGNAQDSVCRTQGGGRRLTDGRAWFEGSVKNAIANGWHTNENGIAGDARSHQEQKQKTLHDAAA